MDQRELLRELTESATLSEIQRYVQKQVELRGFHKESIGESMLLLLEETGELAKAIRKAGGSRVKTLHVATDHSWSDRRLRLASLVIGWLEALPGAK